MKLNTRKLAFFSITLVVVLAMSNIVRYIPLVSWLGIFLFIWVFFEFFSQLAKQIPIKRLIILVASLQWIVAPVLSYHFFTDAPDFYMQIPEIEYMNFVVPSMFVFYLALCVNFNSKTKFSNVKALYTDAPKNPVLIRRGMLLFFIGVIGVILQSIVPNALRFAFFLLAKLMFVGSFYLFAAKVKYRYLLLVLAFLPIVIGAQGSAIFHDMFLWGGYIFMVIAFIQRIGVFKKFIYLLAGLFLILFVQYFKGDYRKEIRVENTEVGTEAILAVAEDRYEDEGLSDEYFQSVVDRLNQGWIVSRIMVIVPHFEPYAEGETINEGIFAALVPRFLVPDKVESGGAFFERFTRLELVDDTSMNLGLIGEAYANYGSNGAMVFLFILGSFLKYTLNWLNKISFKNFEIILWMPFLFLYVVKAEDDFATMFNQLTKSGMVCIAILYFLKSVVPQQKPIIASEEGE